MSAGAIASWGKYGQTSGDAVASLGKTYSVAEAAIIAPVVFTGTFAGARVKKPVELPREIPVYIGLRRILMDDDEVLIQ